MKTLNIFIFATSTLCLSAFAADRTGTILETMDASNYTYMRLKTDAGETWAAVPQTKVKKGEKVTILEPQVMDGFESKVLKRKFDHILFGSLKEEGADMSAETKKAHEGVPAVEVELANIKVEKAKGANGRTVAEIFAQKTELKNKEALVHGKVTKFLPGIMGKNWVHLSDGTGSKEKKDFDLVITTQDNAKVSDLVTVQGKVHTDVNLGSGYFFNVMMEDAKVTKK